MEKSAPPDDKILKADVSLLAYVVSFRGSLQGSSLGSVTGTQLVSCSETLHPGATCRAELAIQARVQGSMKSKNTC